MKEIWSPKALLQLEGLWNFIADDSKAAADSVVERIFASVDLLKTQPEMGRSGRMAGTRELVIPRTPYFIVYRVKRYHHFTSSCHPTRTPHLRLGL